MTLYTRVFQKMCSLSTDVVVASRMMVPLLGDLSRLWKSEGGGGVFLSLTGARKEEQQLYARAFSLASSSTRRRSPKENNTKTHSAFLFCVEMMICFVVVSKKKKFCGTLLSVESIRIEAHTKRERERERERRSHTKKGIKLSRKKEISLHEVWI